jgi:hypothetical protein
MAEDKAKEPKDNNTLCRRRSRSFRMAESLKNSRVRVLDGQMTIR